MAAKLLMKRFAIKDVSESLASFNCHQMFTTEVAIIYLYQQFLNIFLRYHHG